MPYDSRGGNVPVDQKPGIPPAPVTMWTFSCTTTSIHINYTKAEKDTTMQYRELPTELFAVYRAYFEPDYRTCVMV
jgi:hypothetical protein